MATVGMLDMSTVVETSTVATSEPKLANKQESNLSTVVQCNPITGVARDKTTVVMLDPETASDVTTEDTLNLSTVAKLANKEARELTGVSPPTAARAIWVSESGELVPASRVKRIKFAQDVLNSAEESVYNALWAGKSGVRAPAERESCRITQAGYDFLMKRTRLSKKTIQRIVDRLIDKGFIEIHEPADIYHRTSTVYRVHSYRAVLYRQIQRGRMHVAKIGPGFVYVRPYDCPTGEHQTTVVMYDTPTVGDSHPSTDPVPTTPTVVDYDATTVVSAATLKKEQLIEDTSTSSEIAKLRNLLAAEIGPVDDGAVCQLLTDCRSRAGDCSPEEIAYFVRLKLRWVRDVRNPVGFVLTSVPRHFENGGHLSVREILRQESAERERQWCETYNYWTAIAEDPDRPEAERDEARRILESFAPFEAGR